MTCSFEQPRKRLIKSVANASHAQRKRVYYFILDGDEKLDQNDEERSCVLIKILNMSWYGGYGGLFTIARSLTSKMELE